MPVMLLFFLNIASLVYAQQPLLCGNYKIDSIAENNARRYQLLNPGRQTVVNYLVRVYFHVGANDNGTNTAITDEQLASEFDTLLASYSNDNVCFINAGKDTVKNTFLNTLFNADNDPEGTFFSPYQVPGCVNIFYTQKINGNNTACSPACGIGGVALGGIPGTFFLVAKSNIGSGATISHEMGHCLGLLHTFETVFGYENINGSNALTTGDRVTDTPADPYAYGGNSCYAVSVNKCLYTGTCVDSNGASNFSPPYTNLMAYWWANSCYANLAATNGQFSRVNSFLGTFAPLINCSSPTTVILYPTTISSGYYMNSAINTFITSGSVLFNGSAKAFLGGGQVRLQNGFRAVPSAGGKIRIEAKPCN